MRWFVANGFASPVEVADEQILAAFADTGIDPDTTLDLQVLLYSYVQGLAINIEREAHAVATGRYPSFARLMDAFAARGYDLDLDRIFELGLGLMLDGLTPIIETGGRTAPA